MTPAAALIVVVIAAAIAAAIYTVVRERKRRDALRAFCLSSGWTFTPSDPALTRRWDSAPFGQGDNRKAKNVMHGAHGGHDLTAFDYSFDTHSTDSKGNRTTTTHQYRIVALGLPAWLPVLTVSPHNVLTRIGEVFGLPDIDLESETFNRRFRVQAKDRKFATDVLTPRTMELLLAHPACSWRINGTDIVSWHTGRLTPVAVLESASLLGGVIDLVPSFIWSDHSARTADTTDPQGSPSP